LIPRRRSTRWRAAGLVTGPASSIARYANALAQMSGIFIDAGQFDEYQLQVGARLLSRKLNALGIRHVYEEYPDGHRDTHYRYANSLVYLYEVLR
jgi:hypothetical protein